MLYGVTFGGRHSYLNWGLTLKSRPDISPPEPKYVYVDIPSADGQLDLTESLTGFVPFKSRTVTCEFNVIDPRRRWDAIYSEILDYLQGRELEFIKDEDPAYFYKGRFQVDEWESSKRTATLVISGVVEPYKKELWTSYDPWIWDTFNFETGVIREWFDMTVEGTLNVTVVGSRMPVVPIFTVNTHNPDEGMDMTWKGQTYHFNRGRSHNPNIVFQGTNEETLTITGNGSVSIWYQGGRL